jgi:ketopantoate reductase
MTSATVETGFRFAIIDIDLTIVTLKSVDTDARIASIRIMTRGSVLAYVRPQLALVDVLRTITSTVLGGTVARIGAYSVNTAASILA